MVNIAKAQKIEGWMSDQELEWLAEQSAKHELIVEIGCYKGRSTRALSDNTKGIVIAIDDFAGPNRDFENRNSIHKKFISNMQGLGAVLKFVKASYEEAYQEPLVQALHPDMVFIDGDHSYEAVKRDIDFWKPRIAEGGLLCGHDSSHPPIVQAVSEMLGQIVTAPNTSIWFTYV